MKRVISLIQNIFMYKYEHKSLLDFIAVTEYKFNFSSTKLKWRRSTLRITDIKNKV